MTCRSNFEDYVRVKDFVKLLKSGQRIKISAVGQNDDNGDPIWTTALTDAQLYAYWERPVLAHDEEGKTVYCLIS